MPTPWRGLCLRGSIFKSLSGFVVKLVQSRPGLYFRGLNLFTLRQWLSRVHSTYLSMTVICILLLLAVGITASSIGLNSTLEAAADEEAPFDRSTGPATPTMLPPPSMTSSR